MKRALKIAAIVCVIVFGFLKTDAQTNSIVGGEIIYVHIADSTYQFFVKLYSTCPGNTPNSFQVCLNNPCNNTTINISMQRWQTACSTFPSGCPNLKTTCDSAAANIQGYQQCWYYGIQTLPARCNNWRFSASITGRTSSGNLQNASGTSLYLESTFNNTQSHNNSSPFFSVNPAIYIPVNRPFSYNNGGLDSDGDSITVELIMPRTASTSCGATASNLNFSFSNYNLNNNPLPTNNSFSINNVTGQIIFTPSQTGVYNLAFKATEYRNGNIIGTHVREIQSYVYAGGTPDTNNFIVTNLVGGIQSTTSRNTFHTCLGQEINLDYSIVSTNSNASLVVEDSRGVTMPTATTSYLNFWYPDSIVCNLKFTPNNSGTNKLYLFIKNQNCTSPGLPVSAIDSITIITDQVNTPAVNISVSPDSSIAPGTTVTFSAADSGCANITYQWLLNGAYIYGTTNKTYATNNLKNGDKIICRVFCSSNNCPAVLDKLSNAITMRVGTDIATLYNQSNINIYPNPNNGQFTVDITTACNRPNTIRLVITDMMGRIVYTKALNPTAGQTTEDIYIPNILKGLYIVKAITEVGESISRLSIQ
ncbi:MAG: T9SS type A sorting domain-containing protein [Chitinophagales bacterium]|nr:T9SS type A sorting domain-containing protein [Chitinophagaceae bacterium]MCB9064953.1 T9SS type A sorting domain-containing protein [Chitinophagales bacterium]